MKNVKLTKVISALALAAVMAVSSCGGNSGSSNSSSNANKQTTQAIKSTCDVSLEISVGANLIMAKYNIDGYVDGEKIDTFSNDSTRYYTATLEKGKHTFRCEQNGNNSVSGELTFSVNEDGDYIRIMMKAHESYIEVSQL